MCYKKRILTGLFFFAVVAVMGSPLVSQGQQDMGGAAEAVKDNAASAPPLPNDPGGLSPGGLTAPAANAGLSQADANANKPAPQDLKSANIIVQAMAAVAATAISLTAYLIEWAIEWGQDVLNLSIVKEGWNIVLNFANLGFVLAIIVIAFATIFRVESYALKQTLWKLIVAAILVNFSLFIAG